MEKKKTFFASSSDRNYQQAKMLNEPLPCIMNNSGVGIREQSPILPKIHSLWIQREVDTMEGAACVHHKICPV